MSNAVVIGASSGVGRALAQELARCGSNVVVVSRDTRDIEATAADLRERLQVRSLGVALDIASADLDHEAFVDSCTAFLGDVDSVFIPAGTVSDDDVGATPEVLVALTATNYLGPARLAAAFARRMLPRRRGEIVLFSSIAAGAPRTRNAAYSAAKAALEVYARGLRHSLEPQGISVRVYALGYVDTPLSFGRKLLLPIASPEATARHVVSHRDRSGKYYYPRFWWWVLIVLEHMPWALYRRLSF